MHVVEKVHWVLVIKGTSLPERRCLGGEGTETSGVDTEHMLESCVS